MIRRDELIKIGRFNKPHGVHGEISMTFTDDAFDRCDSPYIVSLVDGIFVPFFIEEYRFKNDSTALVKLCDVNNEVEAAAFTLLDVYYPKRYYVESDDAATLGDYFIGFTVVDSEKGILGSVVAIDDATANILFVVATPEGDELLIPAQEAFVESVDEDARVIHMNLPEGLLDL